MEKPRVGGVFRLVAGFLGCVGGAECKGPVGPVLGGPELTLSGRIALPDDTIVLRQDAAVLGPVVALGLAAEQNIPGQGQQRTVVVVCDGVAGAIVQE